jgi:zinc transport system substrate-binding protein
MKKLTAVLIALILPVTLFAGCKSDGGASAETTAAGGAGKKFSVVATIFPQYDWVRQILGAQAANFDLTLLQDNKVDLHSYQPTVDDIVKISNCDLFIYVGGESDEWAENALKQAVNKDMVAINLLEELGSAAKLEEIIEGMEDDEHDHDDGDDEHAHGHAEVDADNVKDRPLSDFDGSWVSGIPLINDGTLDDYINVTAEQADQTPAQRKEYLSNRWASDYDEISISGNKLTINGAEAEYASAGYHIVPSDHGGSVWYAYTIVSGSADMPTYILFHDHGTGNGDGDANALHDDEISHFHLRYGDDGIEELLAIEDWSTYYFDRSFSNAEIGEQMYDGTVSSDDHDEDEHEEEYDEHVWLSLKNAVVLCGAIADALAELDPDNANEYSGNLTAYTAKLSALDGEYQAAADGGSIKTLLFADRFPFRYLVDDYGISYFAAFPGCSAAADVSFETIAFLAAKTDELGLKVVMVTESADQYIAKTVIGTTSDPNRPILVLDSMQSITSDDVKGGVTFLSIMEGNLDVFKEALA